MKTWQNHENKKKVRPHHFNETFEGIFKIKSKTSSLRKIKTAHPYVFSLLEASQTTVISAIFIEKEKELLFKIKQVYQKKQSVTKPIEKKK